MKRTASLIAFLLLICPLIGTSRLQAARDIDPKLMEAPRGMTWVLKKKDGDLSLVGHDDRTNAYLGDTPSTETLPILAIKRLKLPKPEGLVIESTYFAWSGGSIALTKPVQGTRLTSLEEANRIIREELGPGWEMAEFHDGWGWNFWAYGDIPEGKRFWVSINDQYANPWNSQTAGPVRTREPEVRQPVLEMKGERRGMTWVLKKKDGDLSLVGHDDRTNAYEGDTPCTETLPILAIKRLKQPKPEGLVIESHYYSWSGGSIALTKPVQGTRLTSLEEANRIIQDELGPGLEMAEHHDGWGWNFWAYGDIPETTRFWVSINDQPSNPWNSKPR